MEHPMTEQGASPLTEDVRRKIMSVAVPTIVSTLYRKGLRNTMMFAPKPLNPAAAKFVGTAFTVRTIPAREDLVDATSRGERPNLQAEATARVARGDVLVVAMDGETRTAFMGDIMTTHFLAKGVAAAVLDGGVSDAAAIARIPFPVFCCGAAGTPVTSHRMVIELQAAVGCAGVAVFPGDAIFGDANGIVCIPRYLVAEVAEIAEERERMEEWIIERVREGRPLAGTYPPNEATMAEYRAWRSARATAGRT
jgi:regulator of RNase E activity RraA